ncbi:hypothetical protein [Aquitalea sp. LB_tupeE]|uniref:hypothetical protein n=1 Tax=Aquitalea sp. LB_tupeE TaxID=2748078 RepID=UPI0015B8F63F|nr:hypothetical protein [Aquitalea sp. LB_tupeE]NWK79824.1 hypothetical protein [Aquitalea sp. LB_tupeE]
MWKNVGPIWGRQRQNPLLKLLVLFDNMGMKEAIEDQQITDHQWLLEVVVKAAGGGLDQACVITSFDNIELVLCFIQLLVHIA